MSTNQDNSALSDENLVKLSRKGDMGAFEELVARHRDKIYARAFSMMRNEDEALDQILSSDPDIRDIVWTDVQ